MVKRYQHQHYLNGCGIAFIANLLNLAYQFVKADFENQFYKIIKGVKVFDIVKFLKLKGLDYKTKFFNYNKENSLQKTNQIINIENSITLISKSEKYPIGHYL